MRLGPFELRRHVRAATAPTPPATQGASGTINQSGFLVTDEYKRELRDKGGLQVFRQMLSSDGTVQEAIEHFFAPLLNASWEIEPASDEPDHLEHAACADAAYFEWLRQPFLDYLSQALEYLPLKFSLFEQSWQVVEAELEISDPLTGEPVVLPSRQFLTFKRFEPRLQETIWQWHVRDGELEAVTQQAWKDGNFGNFRIPAEQLLVFTNRKRGDDFTGRSVLRAAYKSWWLKQTIEKVAAVGIERHAVGVPVAYLPPEYKNDQAMADRIEAILQDLRSGEFSYVVVPGPKAMGSQPGFTLEILSPTGGLPDLTPQLEYHRAEIKAAVLARFAELGHSTVGARATGDVQSIVWFAALHAVANYFADVNQQAIKRLINMNYPGVTRYPKLKPSGIEQRNLAEFADAVGKVVASGAVVADKSFTEWVRRELDAPDPDEPAETDQPPADPNAQPDPAQIEQE